MLFYCFVVVWLLGKFHLTGSFWLLVPLFGFSVFPFNLPFSIGQMLHYLLYFYLGIMVFRYRDDIRGCLNLYAASFLILFYAFALFLYLYLGVAESLDGVSYNVVRLVLNVMGITAIYSTAVCVGDKLDRYYLVRQSNAVSFGVYLFHQFVLMFLLEYTSLSVHVGRYAYPWLCLAIALLFSVLFSSILMKNRVGRSLIG